MVRGLLLGLVIVSAYLVFELGRIKAGYDVVEASNDRQRTRTSLRVSKTRLPG